MKGRGRIKFIISNINRMLFASGVMQLTSWTKMAVTKACLEGKGIDVVINNSTAPPSPGSRPTLSSVQGDKAGK